MSRLKSFLPVLALMALILVAVHPFLQKAMPRTADGLNHLYRIIALEDTLRYDSAPFPRYASGIAYGYGAALFNFYSPVSYYPPLFLHWMELSVVQSWLAAMVLYTFMAAYGAYCLGRAWTNSTSGGLITAAAYVYSPYWLFNAVHRGSLPEVFGLAILPYVLWGFWRLIQFARLTDGLMAAGILALFLTGHNITILHGGLLLAVYLVALLMIAERKIRALLLMLLATITALALSAFYWLPVLLENSQIRAAALSDTLPFLNPVNHLRALSDVLALPFTADPTQLQQPVPITIGWIQILLAMMALIQSFRAKSRLRPLLLLLALFVMFMVFLNVDTPLSHWIWEHAPLLAISQFPWRVQGVTGLALAVMAGMVTADAIYRVPAIHNRSAGTPSMVSAIASLWRGVGGMSGLLIALILYSIPWLYTQYVPVQAATIQEVQAYERATTPGLGSWGEFLPVWVSEFPDANRLAERFAETRLIPRLIPPDDVTIQDFAWRTTSARLELTAESPATLVFDWLYTPGWRAHFVNAPDLPLTVKPAVPDGRVSLEIPAGTYTLMIALENTPVQAAGNAISGIAMGGWLLAVSWMIWPSFPFNHVRARRAAPLQNTEIYNAPAGTRYITSATNDPSILVQAILVCLVIFLFKSFIIDHTQNPLRRERFAGGTAAGAQFPLETNFNREITLIGTNIPVSVKSGDALSLSLFWRLSGSEISRDYSSLIAMRDAAGIVVAKGGSFTPGDLAISNWLPGYYLDEALDFQIPAGTPPGMYTLEAGLYDPLTQEHLSVINAAGNPEDVKVVIGTIEVVRPDRMPDTPENTPLNEIMAFAGMRQPLPENATAGDELILALNWLAAEKPGVDYQMRLLWRCVDGCTGGFETRPYESSLMPPVPGFATSLWQAGDVWTGYHRLYVPGHLDTGDYEVAVQFVDSGGTPSEAIASIGTIHVTTPERTYALPEMQHEADAAWENGLRLRGYSIAGRVSILTLVWQTEQPLVQNLRLFVHVLEGERIVAQWDGIPADWTRPTTGWAIDEVIITQHKFDISEGDYTLRIGWYDPLTGQRVRLSDDSDALVINP